MDKIANNKGLMLPWHKINKKFFPFCKFDLSNVQSFKRSTFRNSDKLNAMATKLNIFRRLVGV